MNIEVSIGEVVDKVTILEIKTEKIKDREKGANVRKEYLLLKKRLEEDGISTMTDDYKALKTINSVLWDIEDRIRIKERMQAFDDEFIELARSVYRTNDERAAIKKRINLQYGSELIEEKEYVDYRKSDQNE